MSFLKKTQKKMQQNKDEELKRSNSTAYSSKGKRDNSWQRESFKKTPSFWEKYKKYIIIGLGSVLGLIFVGAGISGALYLNDQRFQQEDVSFKIQGNTDISVAERQTYTVVYTNNNQTILKNNTISLNLPDTFVDEQISIQGQTRKTLNEFSLPSLEPNESFEFTVSGRFVAEQESLHFLKGKLTYQPGIESQSYTKNTELAISITQSPLIFSVQAPQEIARGKVMEYVATVNNQSQKTFENLQVTLQYPEKFTFQSASINPSSKNRIFRIEQLRPDDVFEVRIRGTLGGEPQTTQVINGTLGIKSEEKVLKYAKDEGSTQITPPYVLVNHNLEEKNTNTANAGETLNYTVTFQNTTDVPIKNGRLRTQLEGEMFDITSLKAPNASFNAGTNTLTWTPSGAPELQILESGERGAVSYSIDLKDKLPVKKPSDKNYTVESNASFESEQIPTNLGVNKIVESNTSQVKLHTKFFPSQEVRYNNDVASIVNSGPNPPQVNEQTTYTIHWKTKNLTNTLSGVQLQSSLPPNVTWTGATDTKGIGDLTFDEGSRTITWNIPEVPPHVGFLRPTYRAVFQVEVTPPPNQRGNDITLLKSTSYQATDTFTQKEFQGTLSELTQQVVR